MGPVVDRVVQELLPKGSRIIDLGCGNGGGSGRFIQAGYQVAGIDPSERGIALAREHYPLGTWHVGLAEVDMLSKFGHQPFDAAFSIEVVEHVYAPREWAAACYECLRPGGILICSTPYHGYLKNLALSVTNKWDSHMSPLWDGGHIKMWSRNTLARLLHEVGFVDLRFWGTGRFPGLWKSMVFAAHKPQ